MPVFLLNPPLFHLWNEKLLPHCALIITEKEKIDSRIWNQ